MSFQSNRILIYPHGFASSLSFVLSEVTFFALPGFFEGHPRELPHSIPLQGYHPQVLPRSGPLVSRFEPCTAFLSGCVAVQSFPNLFDNIACIINFIFTMEEDILACIECKSSKTPLDRMR